MSNINIEVPLQASVSFGQVSWCVLKEFYKLGLSPNIFCTSPNVDLSAFELSQDEVMWLDSCIKQSFKFYSKKDSGFKLWHIMGSQATVSERNALFTFHETSDITDIEFNILKNQSKVLVSSNYTKGVFEKNGLENVVYCPLGFDEASFKNVEKKFPKGVVRWGLFGKMEKRKHTLRALTSWCKKYGNQTGHALHVSLYNPFIPQEEQNLLISKALDNKKYWNVIFLPYAATNKAYNDVLNSVNIVIDVSGGEGFSLPFFQCLCLGKHGICLDAHVFKDYTNKDMVTYVPSSGLIECYDDKFFMRGHIVNQGEIFTFEDQKLEEAMNKALERFNLNPINEPGLALKQTYTYTNTAKIILETLKTL
jgi:hypothetical protein